MPTRAGLVALATAAVLCAAGINSGVNTLFLVSGVVFGAITISIVGAWRQLTGLTVRRRLPTSVHAGEAFSVELRLATRTRRPAHAVLIEDLAEAGGEPWRAFTPYVAGRSAKRLQYSARVRQRGLVQFAGVRLSTRFPFGLVRASIQTAAGDEDALVVYPALGTVRPSFLQGQLGGIRERPSLQPSRIGMTDIHGLREYRPGDNPRWIHWRSSARLGKPVVKEFDREEARRIHVVLDSVLERHAGAEARQRFEWAISFAATLAAGSTRAARMVGLTALGAERIDLMPAAGAAQVRATLEHLARLTPADVATPPVPVDNREAIRNTAVILVVLSPDRLRDIPVGAWQQSGGTVHVVDVSAPAFLDLFIPPAILGGPVSAEPAPEQADLAAQEGRLAHAVL